VNDLSTVFDRMRAACAEVASVATHVSVEPDGIRSLARRLRLDDPDDDPLRLPVSDDEEATTAYVMTLDAINFGSGYFPYIRKRAGHSGYHTVEASLREHVESHGPPTPEWLTGLTPPDCAAIFDQSLDDRYPAELMGHFATALNQLGVFVGRVGRGRFLGVVDAAGQRAARLVELLDQMPYYHDVHRYRGHDVPLYKRAQITAFDLAVAFDHSGPGHFDDIDSLTMFADNLVPHVLRVEGALRFSDELVARIEAVEEIASGSEPEVEIRACGLHAVELLVEELADRGQTTTAGHLDGVLWRMGAGEIYKATPRHRTRCVYY
jgi:hypothetical protein